MECGSKIFLSFEFLDYLTSTTTSLNCTPSLPRVSWVRRILHAARVFFLYIHSLGRHHAEYGQLFLFFRPPRIVPGNLLFPLAQNGPYPFWRFISVPVNIRITRDINYISRGLLKTINTVSFRLSWTINWLNTVDIYRSDFDSDINAVVDA